MNLKASSNIMRPYNDPNFRNIKHYLQPGFPNEYPYSQYINYEGDLVHTPWRESEGPQDYCFSQYADIESQPEESNYAVTRIDPLVLPTQYSSEDSDSEDEEDSNKLFKSDAQLDLPPNLTLRSGWDSDNEEEDDEKEEQASTKKIATEGAVKECNKIDDTVDDCNNERWPTRVFYGEEGELKHPYTRIKKPNLKMKTCQYRCKSYRTFKCKAILNVFEDKSNPGKDIKRVNGEHSEMCQRKNGIRPKNYVKTENKSGSSMSDRTVEFKTRLEELAMDKIWMPPLKIWNMVRDEIVGDGGDEMITIPSSDVVSMFLVVIIFKKFLGS
jgi:hypothetical protein